MTCWLFFPLFAFFFFGSLSWRIFLSFYPGFEVWGTAFNAVHCQQCGRRGVHCKFRWAMAEAVLAHSTPFVNWSTLPNPSLILLGVCGPSRLPSTSIFHCHSLLYFFLTSGLSSTFGSFTPSCVQMCVAVCNVDSRKKSGWTWPSMVHVLRVFVWQSRVVTCVVLFFFFSCDILFDIISLSLIAG